MPGSRGWSTAVNTGLRDFPELLLANYPVTTPRRLEMPASLIRSHAMVTHAIDRHRWNEITDGAVLQEDGIIVEIGTYEELSRKHPNVAVLGSGNEVMLPG